MPRIYEFNKLLAAVAGRTQAAASASAAALAEAAADRLPVRRRRRRRRRRAVGDINILSHRTKGGATELNYRAASTDEVRRRLLFRHILR